MPEQDRVKLLVMVKEGRISVDDVIDVVSDDVTRVIEYNNSVLQNTRFLFKVKKYECDKLHGIAKDLSHYVTDEVKVC